MHIGFMRRGNLMKGRTYMNKQIWTMILLAVLLGIAFGALHAKSVSEKKASIIHSEPTHVIEMTESNEMPLSADVKVIHKAEDPDIPDEIEEACITYGKHYGISPEFLEALIWQESRYISDVVSDDGSCIGLCQINQNCHKKRMKSLGVTDLTDPRQNIAVACDYLAELFQKSDDPEQVLNWYNGSSRKTSKYARAVILKSEELKVKHE